MPMGYATNMDDTDYESRSRSRSSGRLVTHEWVDPVYGDRVLLVKRKFAEMIVDGSKTCELRSINVKCLLPGEKIFIASTGDKQSRRAWPSPFSEHQLHNSQILGSVCFSHCGIIEWDDFSRLEVEHRVDDAEWASRFANKNDGKLRGWFFTNAVKNPEPREYKFKTSSVVWRFFRGWA